MNKDLLYGRILMANLFINGWRDRILYIERQNQEIGWSPNPHVLLMKQYHLLRYIRQCINYVYSNNTLFKHYGRSRPILRYPHRHLFTQKQTHLDRRKCLNQNIERVAKMGIIQIFPWVNELSRLVVTVDEVWRWNGEEVTIFT